MTAHRFHRWLAIRSLPLVVCCVAAFGCAANRLSKEPARQSRQLDAIFDEYFEAYLKLFPTFASEIGDHRYDDQLEIAVSTEHLAAQRRLAQRTLEQLREIDATQLDGQRRLFLEVLRYNLKDTLEGLAFKQNLLPVRQFASLAVEFPLLASANGIHPFKTVGDYENFLKRIEEFPTWIDTAIGNLRAAMEIKIVQPRPVIERTLPQLEAMIADDAKASWFFRPILQMPQSIGASERERLSRAYVSAIEQTLIPGYRRLVNFLREEYSAQTRSSAAWSDLPDGARWYDYLVRSQTTTELTAEEIFDLGQTEIARIKSEMDGLRRTSGFRGSLSEYTRALSDATPRSYSTRAGLIAGYEALRRTVAPNLTKLFSRIPQAPMEITTIEEYREQSAPSQYWSATPDGSRPGIFYINARGIENNPRRASDALFLHEAIPGHHFQISLQREQSGLPRFQQFADYNAFTEGWALYAESLGKELGLYSDADQYLSRLNSELFRAVRLVVDVGLHRKNWSRDHAIRFIMDTTGGGESGASLEVDRYIAVPAQALGYKIGQLKISSLRAKAEKTLGSDFDVRAFHDELLKDGALPLNILEAKMDRWIDSKRR